jgi:feruloyl esterase
MHDFPKAVSCLHELRRKFETLLEAARKKAGHGQETPRVTPLQELPDFGRNPGNLRMWAYVPERLPRGAPLVVALHGCSQSASAYDNGTGWSTLAERFGFAVIYPEQQPANNPKNCFSWFLPGDTARGHGEALSIREMIEHAIRTFGIDRGRIFVTGLSAGGAMASVMLATYPEVFAGGAIIAGLCYGCARSVQQAFEAMFTEQPQPAHVLGERVRAASKHRGPWPKMTIWHGVADPIVKPSNAENILRQWIDVQGLSNTPSYEELIGSHTRRVWNDADGEARIEAFSISGMGHGVPLATRTGEDTCGAVGAFFLDAGISSTHHIARFWCLGDGLAQLLQAPATVSGPYLVGAQGGAIVAASNTDSRASDSEGPSFGAEPDARRRPHDPNHVIAAAFEAAGLPTPNLTSRPATSKHVAPAPIIEAVLKAAGLLSSTSSSAK